MCSTLQVLTLVFMDALDQDVEHRIRIEIDAGALQGERGEAALVVLLDLAPAGAKCGVLGERLEPLAAAPGP